MKKIFKLLMVLFMFMLIPNILKAAEVSIENITLVDHSDLISEKTPASANGLNINFDVSFTNLDDFAKYKVVINNPTNTEYEVEQETDFKSSDHIVYSYSYEGNSKVLKANSKLTMYITLTYKYEVQPDELVDGKFVETNKLTVNLSNGTTNPKTADASTIVLFALMLMLIGSIGLYKYTNRKEYLGTLVALAIIIPVFAYAAEKLKLNVETQITVEEKYNVFYYAYELIKKSEEDKYKIFQAPNIEDGGVVDSSSGLMLMRQPATRNLCFPTENEEYEVCLLAVKIEAYAPGETVHLPNEITLHGVNENGTFVESTLRFNGEENKNVWLPDIEFPPVKYFQDNDKFYWKYDASYNEHETLDFSEDSIAWGVIYEETGEGTLTIHTPASFTMPDRNVYVYTNNILMLPS